MSETFLLWSLGVVVGLAAFWWVVKVSIAYTASPEKTGVAFLRHELNRIGAHARSIPDVAFTEIVKRSIETSKASARAEKHRTRWSRRTNWRANLVQDLPLSAVEIQGLLEGKTVSPSHHDLAAILVKHGVVKPRD